uniref:Uncharacterized protein n=1 Tax=Picea sitchensis TaxID=3332 RepID=A0A6B9XR76_PICSI|nr:hypothetical protein Q903MT_gene5675 [Picea sitchensis]
MSQPTSPCCQPSIAIYASEAILSTNQPTDGGINSTYKRGIECNQWNGLECNERTSTTIRGKGRRVESIYYH